MRLAQVIVRIKIKIGNVHFKSYSLKVFQIKLFNFSKKKKIQTINLLCVNPLMENTWTKLRM